MEQSHTPESRKYSPEDIDEQVDSFVQGYDMDAQRVRAVLDRIINSSWPGNDPGGILDEAIKKLGPTPTLEVFEREDLDELWQRLYIFGYLCRRKTPLYTLDELAERTAAFIPYLESNREHLVKTGYPLTDFPQCWWLHGLLGHLHCVKIPEQEYTNPSPRERLEAIKNGKIARDGRGFPIIPCTYNYVWIEELNLYEQQYVISNPDYPYQEAELIDGIDHIDAEYLEDRRSQIFDLRLQILQRLLKAVQCQHTNGLWKECLQLLTDSLLAEEAKYLLITERDICEAYAEFVFPTNILFQESYSMNNYTSGLNNLLTIIGNYEKELTIGTLHKTREYLPEPSIKLRSYYKIIGQPWRGTADTALDRYLTLEMLETEYFWPEFRTRVNHCLDTEFYDQLIIKPKIKRAFANQFKSAVLGLVDFYNLRSPTLSTSASLQQLPEETTPLVEINQPRAEGTPLVEINQPQAENTPMTEVNKFQREGDVWKITYKGKTDRLTHSKGLHCIAYLLQHAGEMIDANLLKDAVEGHESDPKSSYYSNMSETELESLQMHISDLSDTGKMIDSKAIKDYNKCLKDLEERLRESQQNNDLNSSELIEQIEFFKTELNSSINIYRRIRKFNDPNENLRKSISRNILRDFRRIEEVHPDLEQHLRMTLHRGATLWYYPEPPLDWIVEF